MTIIQEATAKYSDKLSRSTLQVFERRYGNSSVIWRSGIITNAHVIHSSGATIKLSDRRVLDAVDIIRGGQITVEHLQHSEMNLTEAA
jgi:hypothetical protein